MAPSDYTSSGGGALKLKGAGVEKKKKKKKHTQASADTAPSKDEPTTLESGDPLTQTSEDKISKLKNAEEDSAALELSEDVKDDLLEYKSKTEAERRHEERRRQRMHERLKREGAKTHKERVEELNRYLSAQSDHHDMPKIGPG